MAVQCIVIRNSALLGGLLPALNLVIEISSGVVLGGLHTKGGEVIRKPFAYKQGFILRVLYRAWGWGWHAHGIGHGVQATTVLHMGMVAMSPSDRAS